MSDPTPKPVVPPPSRFRIVEAARLEAVTVPVGDWDVVMTNDYTTWTITLLPRTAHTLSCLDLDRAIKTNTLPGVVVVEATVTCGGVIDDDPGGVTVTGGPEEIAAAREAITHFHADERDRENRKVLRAVYRRLGARADV